uniref:RRM domain-containing protein n=1 Tax=Kalanchoe fedtschenkoi TaxID=63787 RepID=A0A7N0TP22_KALFE
MSNPSKPEGEDVETPPSNILWVGYMAADFSEAELMEIFADYGVLDVVISPSSKSYAFAFFMCIEDAKAAMYALLGTSYKGISLKIDFAKPARPCKQLWIGGIGRLVTREKLEASFLKFGKIDDVSFFRERNTAIIMFSKLEEASLALKTMNGKHLCGDQIRVDYVRSLSTRRFAQSSEGLIGQPSKVLWIGYPPSIKIDDQTLHNAMILFGEIESINSFPDRNYSFVEFRSVDEARRAKDGLQGRLLNDPRITIKFSRSGLAPGKSGPGFHPGSKGLVSDTGYGHKHPISFRGSGIRGRPFSLQSGLESAFAGHEVVDSNSIRWNDSPPSLPGARQPSRSCGNFDIKQYEREAKRSRLDILPTDDDHSSSANSLQNFGMPHPDEGSTDIYSSVRTSPLGSRASRFSTGMPNHDPADDDHIWRGVIAKGGTPVCQARCVPIRKGTDWQLPDLVNCYARTGLEMLEKHYAEALGIEIVYFLPDCEEDFDSYTEFLCYLGDKNRAGVAKLHDGTTLFLVPPSDFLTKILNGAGPKRLYGVVLNLPAAAATADSMIKQHLNQSLPSSHYSDRQYVPSTQMNFGRISREEASPYRVNHGLSDDLRQMTKPNFPPVDSFKSQQTVQQYTSSTPVSLPRVTLTPELIATLANIMPATQQSATAGSQQLSGSPSLWPLATSGTGLSSLEWKENQPSGPVNYVPQHLSNPYDPQAQQFQSLQTCSGVPNSYNHDASVGHTSNNVVGGPFDQQQSLNFSGAPTNFSTSSQGGQDTASQQVNQLYEPETILNAQITFGLSRFETQYDPAYVSGQVFGSNLTQAPINLPAAVASTNMGLQSTVQQHDSAPSGSGFTSEVEKNLKYQSTLEFAANLLQQIQQRQQQAQHFEPGSGNH